MKTGKIVLLTLLLSSLAPSAVAQSDRDRRLREVFGLAQEAFLAGDLVASIQHSRAALEIDDRQSYPYSNLASCYLRLGRYRAALEANRLAETMVADRRVPISDAQRAGLLGEVYRVRMDILTALGEYEAAMGAFESGSRIDPAYARTYGVQAATLLLAGGRVAEARPTFDGWVAAMAGAVARYGAPAVEAAGFWQAYLGAAEVRRRAGDDEGALALLERMRRDLAEIPIAVLASHSFEVALRALAGEYSAALDHAERHLAGGGEYAAYGRGILLVRLGRHDEGAATLERFGPRCVWTEATYHLGLAHLRLGHPDRAEEALGPLFAWDRTARDRLAAESDVGRRAGRLVATGDDGTPEEKIERRLDAAHVAESMAWIDGHLFAYRFARAARELEDLAGRTDDPVLAARIEERLAMARTLSPLFDRVVAAAAGGRIEEEIRLTGDVRGRIVAGDAGRLRLAVGGGWVERPWAYTPYAEFARFCRDRAPSAEELFQLAVFLWSTGDEPAAERALLESLAADPTLSDRIDRLVADRRGIDRPDGGFVAWKGRLVTAAERDARRRGLVPFGGGWVAPSDLPHLRQGHQRIDGRWVPRTAAELEARGFRQVEGRWQTPAEVRRLAGEWSHGWRREGRRFVVRTNESEDFADELVEAADQAYDAFAAFFGAEPDREVLTLYAFKDFADYREYCLSIDQADHLGALGFAPSEPGIACGYDKFDDRTLFRGTMIHEGCHLFFQEAFGVRTPSWLAEGMATYFEACQEDGGRWTFGRLNASRLRALQKAVTEDRLLPLDAFLTSEAHALIQNDSARALTFYAQCWGTFYFFQKTTRVEYRRGFARYLDAIEAGRTVELLEVLGVDAAALERDLEEFWRGL